MVPIRANIYTYRLCDDDGDETELNQPNTTLIRVQKYQALLLELAGRALLLMSTWLAIYLGIPVGVVLGYL